MYGELGSVDQLYGTSRGGPAKSSVHVDGISRRRQLSELTSELV